MDYQKLYDSIIHRAKSSDRKKGRDVYYELHHILPKCLGGGDENENLVLLTAREHYVCHKLLFFMFPNNLMLCKAYRAMVHLHNRNKRIIKLTSREYEEARIISSIASRRENLSPETRKIMSEKSRNRTPESKAKKKETENNKSQAEKDELSRRKSESHKNKRHSEETIKKMKKSASGKIRSEEHCENISKSKQGIKQRLETVEKREQAKRNRTKEQKDESIRKMLETIRKKPKHERDESTRRRIELSSMTIKLNWQNIRQERAMMIF